MAAISAPDVLPRPAQASRSTATAAPKLRDSCHSCAASKVRCNKEKPTCARCAKRSLTCEYFVTKRAGRKHDSKSSNTAKATQALPGSSSSNSSGTGNSISPNFMEPSARQQTSSYLDILPNLLSATDPAWSSTFTNISTEFDDFSASPISFSMLDAFEPEILTQTHIDSRGVDNGLLDSSSAADFLLPEDTFDIMDETNVEPPSLPKSLSLPNSQDSATSDTDIFQDFHSESTYCCLVSALGLLKQLFPNASTICTRSKRQGYEDAAPQLPTIQSVVAENEQTIEAISNMLQCPCSHDGYLLAIMSLIVFKVLGWYAAAARDTPMTDDGQSPGKSPSNNGRPSSCHSEQVSPISAVVGSYCIDGEDQGRMAAQLILSELHRVQRLVNLLSQRLKGQALANSAADGKDAPSDGESTSPFSAIMLDQLEADLRKRLRALSLEIVDMLRRG